MHDGTPTFFLIICLNFYKAIIWLRFSTTNVNKNEARDNSVRRFNRLHIQLLFNCSASKDNILNRRAGHLRFLGLKVHLSFLKGSLPYKKKRKCPALLNGPEKFKFCCYKKASLNEVEMRQNLFCREDSWAIRIGLLELGPSSGKAFLHKKNL